MSAGLAAFVALSVCVPLGLIVWTAPAIRHVWAAYPEDEKRMVVGGLILIAIVAMCAVGITLGLASFVWGHR